MSLALSAPSSPMPLPSAPPKACTFSAAPTVIRFLPPPGEPTVEAPGPALPAANTIVISWLPAAGTAEPAGCASRTSPSYS